MKTSHQLARELLAGPDLPIFHFDPSCAGFDPEADTSCAEIEIQQQDSEKFTDPDDGEEKETISFLTLCGKHEEEHGIGENSGGEMSDTNLAANLKFLAASLEKQGVAGGSTLREAARRLRLRPAVPGQIADTAKRGGGFYIPSKNAVPPPAPDLISAASSTAWRIRRAANAADGDAPPIGKALVMGDMVLTSGGKSEALTGIFVEFTRSDLWQMKWNPMYQPVQIVPATPRSARVHSAITAEAEKIVAAAIRQSGVVHTGAHHHQIIRQIVTCAGICPVTGEQGFLTSRDRFVDRVEARAIAEAAGQVKFPLVPRRWDLFSEELWHLPNADTKGAQ